MWIIEDNKDEPGKVHYLPCEKVLIVSRKDGHILLQGDNSISRQHASITINHSIENLKHPEIWPKVNLRDLAAKYGTFTNDGIEQNVKIVGERVVNDGDRIRFGMLNNTWRLKYRPLVVTTSVLQPASKGEIQAALVKLGGHLVGDWCSSCSLLVMNNITLTIKVVCALAAAQCIVTPDYFSRLVDAVMNKKEHPDTCRYLPPLQEMSINQTLADFSPNERRKQVLNERTFIFPSAKQLKKMAPAVMLAGGEAVLLSQENYKLVASTNNLLVQLPLEKNQEPARSALFKLAKEFLKSKGLRVIPESDIGLAVLYLSTEAHCNSSFVVSNILRRNGSSSMTQTDEGIQIYATETEDVDEHSVCLMGTRVVPESGMTSSRRTPATLQGTSFPLSSQGVSTTLLSSSFASTNASMLPPPGSSIPGKSDREDKENLLQRSSKRLRTVSRECSEPQSKRSNRLASGETNAAKLEPTQPMEDQGGDDDDDISEVFPAGNLSTVSKFEPAHCSTQRHKNTSNRTIKEESKTPPKQNADSEDALNVSKDTTATLNGGDLAVGRSIPFEPYTLPSLNAEDDISTEPFVSVVKEESDSLPVDEPDRCSGKRRRNDELNVPDEEMPGWLGKKKKADNTDDVHIKRERNSFSNDRMVNPRAAVKQELPNEDDLFTLPTTSERSRRRSEAKRKAAGEGAAANVSNEDFFDLPTSSRAERRKKMMKAEEKEPQDVEARIAATKAAINARRDQQIATTSKNSGNALTSTSRCADSSENGNWISKTSGGSLGVSKSPVKGKTVVCNVPTKCEPKLGDVAELGGAFEKSLIVIEVASLVRRPQKKTVSASSSQSLSNGNLKNFKRFKKTASDIVTLPKIIGGRDLVPHDVAEISRRDGWLRDNPDVTLLIEDREVQQHQHDAELDALFDLAPNPRVRARAKK